MVNNGPLLSFIPAGWRVGALHGETENSPLRAGPLMCSPETGQSPFVLLRTLPRATVYLGGLIDQRDRVHQWLEIWVEQGMADETPEEAERAWKELADAMEALDGSRLMASVWPRSTPELEALSFNKHGGHVLVRKYAAFELAQYSELVSRASIREPVLESKLLAALCPPASSPEEIVRFGEGFYLLSRRGSAGLFGESLFLKLNLLHQILLLCERAAESLGQPFLNLTSRSFGVEFNNGAGMLPAAWTVAVALRDPGARLQRFLELDEATYFSLSEGVTQSIYQSREVKPPIHGSGTVRLRKVEPHGDDFLIEGTLASAEPLAADGLLEIHLDLPSERLVLKAHLVPGGGQGECRFKTVAKLNSEQHKHIGEPSRLAPFQQVSFTVRPALSSACDLYSIAVIGMELLLVDGQQSLSVALDEMISLGNYLQSVPVSDEIPFVIEKAVAEQTSGNWSRTLGPQRLIQDADGRPFSYDEALAYVPSEIWWRTIYLLLRLLTNGWHFNYCKHLNDAPSLAQHTVYRQPRAQLETTLDQLRSLILLDWDLNQEIRSLIEGRLGN